MLRANVPDELNILHLKEYVPLWTSSFLRKSRFIPFPKGLLTIEEYNRWWIPHKLRGFTTFFWLSSGANQDDQDTLWLRVFYAEHERKGIDYDLKKIYTLLHSDGNESALPYLNVDAIDYCTFGNSKPIRIKNRNIINDNFSYFYVKKTDASRICGLEFEHMLSPYNLNFLINSNSLIEEHIAGIPGDDYIKYSHGDCSTAQQAQIAKEYEKFNERSMIRLLGDMRAYNYVIIPIHDFDQVIYKIRAIDLISML